MNQKAARMHAAEWCRLNEIKVGDQIVAEAYFPGVQTVIQIGDGPGNSWIRLRDSQGNVRVCWSLLPSTKKVEK